jgi:hypothetical protein
VAAAACRAIRRRSFHGRPRGSKIEHRLDLGELLPSNLGGRCAHGSGYVGMGAVVCGRRPSAVCGQGCPAGPNRPRGDRRY